ncbi:MAG: glutathione S-transferase family protein [Proteobacteria bacterium]|nr:glutathione S-transferase family protein [Burkholderiales bacterium]
MLKVYGRRNSSNVQKVLWCCAEIGVPFERVDMGREFGGNREPVYLAMNPNALVPTIVEDDGFTLWESNAIVRYLARRYASSGLYPEELKAVALCEQWMDWQLHSLNEAFTPLFHGLVRESVEKRNLELIEKSRGDTQRHLAMLDRHLHDSRYVAGEVFSVADIPVGIYAYRWYTFDALQRDPLPALERWYVELQQRAAYRETVMVGLA